MKITVLNTKKETPKPTVGDMKQGWVYRVCSDFHNRTLDDGTGQVCLKVDNKTIVILNTFLGTNGFFKACTDGPDFCGDENTPVAEVLGTIAEIILNPIE